MEEIDYIIVGDGYAGMFFAHRLIMAGKKFRLFSSGEKGASHVSAGIINPVVLKKFTTFWKAQEQIDMLKSTLSEISEFTGEDYFINEPVHRIFHDENERNLWLKKSETQDLKPFLSPDFEQLTGLENNYGTGKVLQSARVDVEGFFRGMKEFLTKNNFLVNEVFNYALLRQNFYKEFEFKNIVFCEGMGVKANPYFSEVEVLANKGHRFLLKIEGYNSMQTGKKKHFLFPTKDNLYYYGGTYDRDDAGFEVNSAATGQLKNGLEEIYPGKYAVENVDFGFRPTVKDRRPILGSHNKYINFFIFNGLGARGILNGAYFSQVLYSHIENGIPLAAEVDFRRF